MEWITLDRISEYAGKRVELRGWVTNRRSSGKIGFLQLRDGPGQIQCVVVKGKVSPEVSKGENIIVSRRFALRHNFKVVNQALVARLKDKPYFIDFQNVLCPRTEPAYQTDGIHLQDIGRQMVAQAMGKYLKEHLSTTAALGGGPR